jgi:hypothetical protein
MSVIMPPPVWPKWLGEELADTNRLKALLAPTAGQPKLSRDPRSPESPLSVRVSDAG